MSMNDINDALEDRERKRLGMDWGQYNAFKFGEMHAARTMTEILYQASTAIKTFDPGASRGKHMKALRKIVKLIAGLQ